MKKADAIKHFGSIKKLAQALRIHPAAISQWGEDVPEGRAYQLEVITHGALKANDSEPGTESSATHSE